MGLESVCHMLLLAEDSETLINQPLSRILLDRELMQFPIVGQTEDHHGRLINLQIVQSFVNSVITQLLHTQLSFQEIHIFDKRYISNGFTKVKWFFKTLQHRMSLLITNLTSRDVCTWHCDLIVELEILSKTYDILYVEVCKGCYCWSVNF